MILDKHEYDFLNVEDVTRLHRQIERISRLLAKATSVEESKRLETLLTDAETNLELLLEESRLRLLLRYLTQKNREMRDRVKLLSSRQA